MASAAMQTTPLPKNTLIVAQENGRLYKLDFTEYPHLDDPGLVDWEVSVSKIVIGKIQQTRQRFITLEGFDVENIVQTNQFPVGSSKDFDATVFVTLDGKNVVREVTPALVSRDGANAVFACRQTGQNFSIQIRGTYNINTMTVTFHNHGKR